MVDMNALILFLVLAEIATVSFCLLHCWFLFINNITVLVYILVFSIAVIKHWIKEASRGDVLFCFHVLITVHYWRKTGQKLKQEQRKEPQRNSAYWLALHCFSQVYLHRDCMTHSMFGFHTSISNQWKVWSDMPKSQTDGDQYPQKIHYSKIYLCLTEFIKISQYNVVSFYFFLIWGICLKERLNFYPKYFFASNQILLWILF